MTGETAENADTQTLYQKFREGQTLSSVLIMEPLVELNKVTQYRQEWLRAVRLGGLLPLMVGRIRVDFETDGTLPDGVVPPESFSARREANVALKPNGARETGWVFLDQSETNKLVEDVDKMIRSTRTSGGTD